LIGLSLFDSVCLLDWSVYVELLGLSDVKPRGPPLRPHTDQPAVTSQDREAPVKLERNTGTSQTANSTGSLHQLWCTLTQMFKTKTLSSWTKTHISPKTKTTTP